MARSSELPAVRDLESVTRVLAQHRRVAVHAEDETWFRPASAVGSLRSHQLQRPVEAVIAALETLELALRKLPERTRPRLVLCHATTRVEVDWLRRMKDSGFDVWGETCPHYLLLTEDDYLRQGARLKVNPPLRSVQDQHALREALVDGVLDFVSSDHAPHTPAEKADEATAPSGIPGIEWMAPALLHLVDAGVIDRERLLALSSRRACECYGIADRGEIADGKLADLVLMRRARDAGPTTTFAGYAPYAELELEWRVETAIVRGHVAYAHGTFAPKVPSQEVTA